MDHVAHKDVSLVNNKVKHFSFTVSRKCAYNYVIVVKQET